jgi:broad specificity phosphatase PhoE
MSFLTVVRHAQASFGADNYDCLSTLGEEQARRLANYCIRRDLDFSEVYVGPRARQQQTAALVRDVYFGVGLAWPEAVVSPELDEYDIDGLLNRLAPQLARQDHSFRSQIDLYRESEDNGDRPRQFQRMFEVLMTHWQEADDGLAGLETWPEFRERVRRGLRRILDKPGRGRRVALFTSGGVVGVIAQLALAAPDRTALELSWRVQNCGMSEFVFTRDRLTLDTFNAAVHLEEAALRTYR